MQPIDLHVHPEGGRFREVFRSSGRVLREEGGDPRCALTHIYFALQPGEVSRFHRVNSDEVWNLYRGGGVRLHTWEGSDAPPEVTTLTAGSDTFCHVIPAGVWQAAEPMAGPVLVGCSVAPGFEFTDFELMDPGSEPAQLLRSLAPELSRFVTP